MTNWQVQSAKQRFSEVLRAAEAGEPQFITKHGETVAVLVDIADYRRTHAVEVPLTDYLLTGRVAVELDGDLELPVRVAEPDRAGRLLGVES